jgi:hypothetical protein
LPPPAESDVTTGVAPRIAVLVMMVAALGLPVNDLVRYAVLLFGAVAIFSGDVRLGPARWFAALAVIVVAVIGATLWPAPRIDEGHNVFIVDETQDSALERALPAEAYRLMAAEFEARYPRARRCTANTAGCWRSDVPSRAYAFSADAIHGGAAYSRRVMGIDFFDPVWLRLGAINEGYNWSGGNELQRNKRESRWKLLHPWRLDMPYFVMVRLPSEFAGSQLCWQGLLLWEKDGGRFDPLRSAEHTCRMVEAADTGRMIFGVAISAPLRMHLEPTWTIRLRVLIESGLAFIAALAVLLLLVRLRPRPMALPMTLIGFGLLVVFLQDASFIGGLRPFDGGDDGLVYESMGRAIVQKLLAGDVLGALEGGEKVFYYGGPGLRYLRAFERLFFGDTFLGYLSLMLAMPLLVFALFKRFFTPRAALALTLVFVAVPIGALFGSTYFQYVKWAARGFADPAAAALFVGALVNLVGREAAGPDGRFGPALAAGLLFALALWVRPNLAPGAGVLLGGAGLAALWQGHIVRVAGLCIGFLPMFGMALHNWYFGGVFVLFSSNATIVETVPMPPSAYVAAISELLRLDFAGEHVRRGMLQMARWLAGPSESFAMIPFNALAIAVLIRVVLRSGIHDPWLRLIAAAALAQHTVAWFYLSSGRYYYLTWFLTLLVCAVWARDDGFGMLQRRAPRAVLWLGRHPARAWLAGLLDRLATLTAISAPAR